MTTYSQIIASLTDADAGVSAAIPDSWRQGRTAFGGVTAALCVEVAQRTLGALPPLRSAQFAFIGPASGDVRVTASSLRRGRSAVFANVDLSGDDGLAVRALLCFGAARVSAVRYSAAPPPATLPAAACAPAFPAGRGPVFLQNFDVRDAHGPEGQHGSGAAADAAPRPERLLWARHRDATPPSSIAALIALADAPPPPAMRLFPAPGPISTMTWMIDVLTETPTTTDGWWLVHAVSETIGDGYSSQATTVWNTAGAPIMLARQSVAVFV